MLRSAAISVAGMDMFCVLLGWVLRKSAVLLINFLNFGFIPLRTSDHSRNVFTSRQYLQFLDDQLQVALTEQLMQPGPTEHRLLDGQKSPTHSQNGIVQICNKGCQHTNVHLQRDKEGVRSVRYRCRKDYSCADVPWHDRSYSVNKVSSSNGHTRKIRSGGAWGCEALGDEVNMLTLRQHQVPTHVQSALRLAMMLEDAKTIGTKSEMRSISAQSPEGS